MIVAERILMLIVLFGLAGCQPEIPPGAICVDGMVWVPHKDTGVATMLHDSIGAYISCRSSSGAWSADTKPKEQGNG